MKRLFVAFLVCVLLVTLVAPPFVSLATSLDGTDSTENTTQAQTEASSAPENTAPEETEPVLAQEPQWMDYSSFLLAQAQRTMADPSIFIGCIAEFNDAYSYVYYASGVDTMDLEEENNSIPINELLDDQGNSIRVRAVDYAFDELGQLWYKIEAAEGYTLPQVLVDNPYVFHLYDAEDDFPSLVWVPLQGMFIVDTVEIKKQPMVATRSYSYSSDQLPTFFNVTILDPYYTLNTLSEQYDLVGHYDLGDVSSWADELTSDYRYVAVGSVLLISPEVTYAYEKLMATTTAEEYDAIWNGLSDLVKDQFTPTHSALLTQHKESITPDEPEQPENPDEPEDPDAPIWEEKEVTVDFNGQPLTVGVAGNIPAEVALTVTPVSNEVAFAEGFDVDSVEEIIAALDITLLNTDGTEWQPADGERVTLTIDAAPLGLEENEVFRFHHKHGDEIQTYEIFTVVDGKITFYAANFSMYMVSNTSSTQIIAGSTTLPNAQYGNAATVALTDRTIEYIFYADIVDDYTPDRNETVTISDRIGTWSVTDTSGAIHYNVYSNTSLGHNGMNCPWIKVIPLKPTTTDTTVTLVYNYSYTRTVRRNNWNSTSTTVTGSETYTLTINAPKAAADQYKLYIRDDVNTTGCITAILMDDERNVVSLEGSTFSWSRNDDKIITPRAYEGGTEGSDYLSHQRVNIARDHGGLVEARKNEVTGTYDPTTYTVNVLLPSGQTVSASYTVYYQSEVINASFESPDATTSNYTFFPNGWQDLFWETTAPGTGSNLTKDIEYGDVTNQTANADGNGTGFGVTYAADFEKNGVQFAELNAEAFGALFQDIITAPGEDIDWSFSHAARQRQDWNSGTTANRMYIVIGATEDAQKLITQTQLEQLGSLAKTAADNNTDFWSGKASVTVTYNGGVYQVWYHDAGTQTNANYTQNATRGWTQLSGTYHVPEGQYRTRVFFVSDPPDDGLDQNFGNLIDSAQVGQYLSYLIEYYEESFVTDETGTHQIITYRPYKVDSEGNEIRNEENRLDEKGVALIYSSQGIKNLSYFLASENDYLHKIMINGQNYPYDIRDLEATPTLYVEQYGAKGVTQTLEKPDTINEGSDNVYANYDIVMQVYIRDTVVAVRTEIQFPYKKDANGNVIMVDGKPVEAMTDEQKLDLIESLENEVTDPVTNEVSTVKGYLANYQLDTSCTDYDYHDTGTSIIAQRDPTGRYTSFISLGDNPKLGHTYYVTETSATRLVGLKLVQVQIKTNLYKYGAEQPLETITNTITTDDNMHAVSTNFDLTETGYKIAEIDVINMYEEIDTVIYYEAVGKGKVQLATGGDYLDTPTETLKFYSGVSTGAQALAGHGATFVGWYTDPSCTEEYKIQAKHGVYDKTTGIFKPNANLITDEGGITFYAKFETGTITINRTNGDPYQTYVYRVTGPGVDTYVTVHCDKNGNGSQKIQELPAGSYTVTEMSNWSWRFGTGSNANPDPKATATITTDAAGKSATVNFSNSFNKNNWLNEARTFIQNIFKGDTIECKRNES